MNRLFVLLSIIIFSGCNATSEFSDSEKAAFKQSKRFARDIWDDKDTQNEYSSYFDEPKDQFILNNYYKSFEGCRAKDVQFLESKELRPNMITFIYRANLSCGEKVIGITYQSIDDKLVPFSMRTIESSEYSNDSVFNPS